MLNMGGKVERSLVHKQVHDVARRAELDVDAGLLGLAEVNELGLVGELVHALLKFWELLVESVELSIVALSGMLNDILAKLTDKVALGVELVGTACVGDGSKCGDGEGAHLNFFN